MSICGIPRGVNNKMKTIDEIHIEAEKNSSEIDEEIDTREIKTMYRLHLDVKEKGKWRGRLGTPFPKFNKDDEYELTNFIMKNVKEGYGMFRIRIDTIYYKDFPDSLNPKEVVEIIKGS
jgi:hypothetical protein